MGRLFAWEPTLTAKIHHLSLRVEQRHLTPCLVHPVAHSAFWLSFLQALHAHTLSSLLQHNLSLSVFKPRFSACESTV